MARTRIKVTRPTSPGTCTSIRRRPESSLVHDQSRGVFVFGLMFWGGGSETADEEFFMIPRKPGREFEDFVLDLGLVGLVAFVVDISWMRGAFPLLPEVALLIPVSGIEVDDGVGVVAAPVKAAMVDAGRWTDRGRSLPLLAILGVPISRDSVNLV